LSEKKGSSNAPVFFQSDLNERVRRFIDDEDGVTTIKYGTVAPMQPIWPDRVGF